jgi:hypothetical protein
LDENTPYHHNPKDIGTDMCQLIVPRKSQFESNTESLLISFLPTNLIYSYTPPSRAVDIP